LFEFIDFDENDFEIFGFMDEVDDQQREMEK